MDDYNSLKLKYDHLFYPDMFWCFIHHYQGVPLIRFVIYLDYQLCRVYKLTVTRAFTICGAADKH
jgi:hypothetical protein